MSNTATMNPSELPDSVPTGGRSAWRISQGKIQRGRHNEEESRPENKILGKLVRIGTHYGELEDGRKYARLECDLHTNTGVETVGVSLRNPTNQRPTLSSCISLAEGLLGIDLGDIVQIEAVQGKKLNRYGSYSTYARVNKLDPSTFRPVPSERAERPDNYGEEYLDDLIVQLEKHPAWAPRPARDSGGDSKPEPGVEETPIEALNAACAMKGWPGPYAAKDAWLALFRRDDPGLVSLEEVSAEAFAAATANIERATKLPAFLAEAATQGEFDPFAD